jgi:ABC-type sugar transport system permease subunit
MKKKHLTLRQKRAITGLLFILPWLIGFLVYYVKGLIFAAQFSVSSIKILDTGGYTTTFIGLDNFKNALFEHATFNQILMGSIQDIIIDVPFITFFSLFIAIMLNARFKGRGLVRAIFFLPILLGSGAMLSTLQLATQNIQGGAATSIAEMSQSNGLNIDYYLDQFMGLGFPEIFAGYLVSLVGRLTDIVKASSVQIIIFIASLQSISPSLYEVSKIEGATTYETFWKVTFPMVSPLILTNVVYTIVDSFVNSDVVDIAYKTAFTGGLDYGLSSAMSMLSTAIVCLILIIIGGVISRFTFYYN